MDPWLAVACLAGPALPTLAAPRAGVGHEVDPQVVPGEADDALHLAGGHKEGVAGHLAEPTWYLEVLPDGEDEHGAEVRLVNGIPVGRGFG